MSSVRSYLRRHHVGLLALLLVISGGTAYAATNLPKNSVASKQVKNNSLKGKDLKDGNVSGADLTNGSVSGQDLDDGSVSGADLADGSISGTDILDDSVGSADLARTAADEVRVFHYSGGNATVWEEPGLAKATFSITCGPAISVNSFAALSLSPGRAGVYGLEDLNRGSEPAGTAPLVGAATVSRFDAPGLPVGGAGFGGSEFGFGQIVMYFQTPTMDVFIDIRVSICSARGSVSIDYRTPDSTPLASRPGRGDAAACEATGDAYCREQAA